MTVTAKELFVDEPALPPIICDRSTIERYANCPEQGYQVSKGFVSNGSTPADAGSETHRILAEAVKLRRTEGVTASDLRVFIESEAMKARPDIQPQVVWSLRRVYPIVEAFCSHSTGTERSPDDLLRYDGGEGRQSGQLAADLMPQAEDGSRGPVRLTCEVDLLMAGASVEEVEVVDWKSGNATWTATEVKDSFQFQFYAYLVLRNYPAVNRVRFRVFMTRDGYATSPVDFDRKDAFAIHKRLMSAAAIYLKYRDAEDIEKVPAWPAPEKCSLCPVAHQCSEAHKPMRDLSVDPEGFLRQFIALESAADKMKAMMSVAVRKNGKDLIFRDDEKGSVAFGIDKPKAARAASCDSYDPK